VLRAPRIAAEKIATGPEYATRPPWRAGTSSTATLHPRTRWPVGAASLEWSTGSAAAPATPTSTSSASCSTSSSGTRPAPRLMPNWTLRYVSDSPLRSLRSLYLHLRRAICQLGHRHRHGRRGACPRPAAHRPLL